MEELVALLGIEEICQALGPSILIFNQYFNQLLVVLQLRVDNLDVLFVFPQQVTEILECFLYPFREASHCLTLRR